MWFLSTVSGFPTMECGLLGRRVLWCRLLRPWSLSCDLGGLQRRARAWASTDDFVVLQFSDEVTFKGTLRDHSNSAPQAGQSPSLSQNEMESLSLGVFIHYKVIGHRKVRTYFFSI
ncbi:uncharacterized protein LOC130751730 [Actinidia eriantha]|uniref:uncharacterized protein LOC130751730 n=1 Tax=Actinidia eriantha TaxID=165200 RepID=UPI002582712F|nr:uncharacterized protein LOC130751730 [Actinidia eriantha]